MLRAAGTQDDLLHLQKQCLIRGFDILTPGGSLIYDTCRYNLAENKAVVQELSEQHPVTLQSITLPVPHSHGLLQARSIRMMCTCSAADGSTPLSLVR